jgi:TonB family protein
MTETALTEIEVDSMVERDPTSAAPMYPAEMLEKSIEGATFVHYVVDTTGRVDTLTIRVIRSTHAAFTRSVREALGLMRFRPAVQGAQRVRQWVQQNFAFKILQRAPPADTT